MNLRSRIVSSAVVALIGAGGLAACTSSDDRRTSSSTVSRAEASEGLTLTQRRRAEAMTSVFENATTQVQYGYVAELGDGRGITAGRAGFTSATGDLVVVVRRYLEARPSSPLARYLPVLERLADDGSDDTSELGGFSTAWERAASDVAMRDAQDAVLDELYYRPAVRWATSLGASLPLTVAVLYDTAVQHGDGDDPDGLGALIAEANEQAEGTPKQGVDETAWLRTFLAVRRAHLGRAADPATRDVWAESVGRVDALEHLLDRGVVALDTSFVLPAWGERFTIA
jgi:chitosanase